MTPRDVDAMIADHAGATELLAVATERELELQSLRGIRKDEAIRRIMAAQNLAATPAEKIVETDTEYSAFLRDCRRSVADRIRMEGQYKAACYRVELALIVARRKVGE